MKLRCYLAAAVLGWATMACGELRQGDLVVVGGDSITEQKLYSVYLENYLLMCRPAEKLRLTQFGWGGEKAPDFARRVTNDVLPFHPTVAVTCYGMNDGAYTDAQPGVLKMYGRAMEQIVDIFQQAGTRFIVVGSPGVVDSTFFKKGALTPSAYNQTLAELTAVARQVAEKKGVAFADVHTPMLAVMSKAKAKYGEQYPLAADGVHPGPNGHLIMAYAFLKALGCDGDIGTLTMDWVSGQAQTTDGHRILTAAKDRLEVESVKYPFCFYGRPEDPQGTVGILEFLPFNQELNRLLLVVKKLPDGNWKVTWGQAEKNFSSAELAQGINLAAEFLDNPFSEPFAQVEKAVKAQQKYETIAVKNGLFWMPYWYKNLPNDGEAAKQFAGILVSREQELQAAASDAVVPVKHTIRLEPAP
jgi:lysophospholipase L1-like esterase